MSQHLKLSENPRRLLMEVILRLILIALFIWTDDMEPFHRKLQPEELWLYRFPKGQNYYPTKYLWITVIGLSAVVIGGFYLLRRDLEDFIHAALGAMLAFGLCGVVTNCIKLAVGRPRPDFLQRCFPKEERKRLSSLFINISDCTGKKNVINGGLKSFPSGHSSHSMSNLGYLGFYVAGKLRVFSTKGQGSAWHMLAVVALFLWPTMIAISRTADYHHHWQDVSVGLILGFAVAYFTYFQFYPPLNHINSHQPYSNHRDRHHDIEIGSHPLPFKIV
ncbi:hypothetical protein SNE40_012936 [Patella caerulea]|uniref:Phosphatidic acid phosphatase type 2/haloperoxidase domain-containing protein n=1 Tax=Patella caerulea TaxID=87958 RepID=A0AAN8PG69_PATCE